MRLLTMPTQIDSFSVPIPLSETLASQTLYYDFTGLAAPWFSTAAAKMPLVVWRDEINEVARQNTHCHRDFCSLYIVRKGSGFHVINNVRYALARGDVYAMGPGMSHYFEGCDSLLTETFHFTPAVFDRNERDALAGTPGFHSLFVSDSITPDAPEVRERWLHLTPTQHAAVEALVAEIKAEWSAGFDDSTIIVTRGLFFRLLVKLSRFVAADSRLDKRTAAPIGFAGGHEETVAAAVRYLEEHFAERLRLEQVAALVFLSPDRFTEVFAGVVGRTPRDYLHHIRIEHAKMLLTSTDLPIGEISFASGFAEAAYFTRVIRSATGMSPSQLRRSTSK